MTPEELREALMRMINQDPEEGLSPGKIEGVRGEVVLGIEHEESGELFFITIMSA